MTQYQFDIIKEKSWYFLLRIKLVVPGAEHAN